MMMDKKLQLKDGQTIAILYAPIEMQLEAEAAGADKADAVLVFATNKAELTARIEDLARAAHAQKLTWVAYPKAKQLSTDLNRDVVAARVNEHGLRPVRQIAIDDTWSGLRLKER